MPSFRTCDNVSRRVLMPNPKGSTPTTSEPTSVFHTRVLRCRLKSKKIRTEILWRAMRNQLMAKYASTPETGGYGIYLVFWFGKECTQPSPSGKRPADAEELKERLEAEATLSADEARKISVCIIDVCKP